MCRMLHPNNTFTTSPSPRIVLARLAPPPDGAAPEEKWSHHDLPPSGAEQIDLKRAIEQVDSVDPAPVVLKARPKDKP